MNEQQKAQETKRLQEKKATVLAFQSLFLKPNPNAELVLKKLSEMCNENEPTFVDKNPTGSAYREGQRSIIIGIRKMLKKDIEQKRQGKAEL